jgi:hypothetical protein
MQFPVPGNSRALDRYIASTHIQSSNVSMPVSSCHQYFAHQWIDSVAVRSDSNSRSRLLSFALTAGLSVVPVSSSRSSSLQNVGRSSSGRNLMYSVRGFRTPTSWVSGQQIVACSMRKVSTAPRVVWQTCQSCRRSKSPDGLIIPFRTLLGLPISPANDDPISRIGRCCDGR